MLGYNPDLVLPLEVLFQNMVFSMELSQPLPKRQTYGRALMNSRCTVHPKCTLTPRYTTPERLAPPQPSSSSPKEQPQASASSRCWEPEPQIPHPELSSPLSLSHWELWEYLQGFRICFLFGNQNAGDWDQCGKLSPLRDTCSSSHNLASWGSACSSQDFLVVLCPLMG